MAKIRNLPKNKVKPSVKIDNEQALLSWLLFNSREAAYLAMGMLCMEGVANKVWYLNKRGYFCKRKPRPSDYPIRIIGELLKCDDFNVQQEEAHEVV